MAYLHCHSCEWSQDDFWHEGWNPVVAFQRDLDDLLYGDLDAIIQMDPQFLKDRGYTQEQFTRRKHILHHLSQIWQCVNNMKYRTEEEYREKNPERKCPSCGERALDID